MTKRREQQKKRQKSKEEQAAMHDGQRLARSLAEYESSTQENFDEVNERIRAVDGEDAAPPATGPDYKKKRRQKTAKT
ncbi:MAG TPA: hypothetical protein VFF39_06610 [Verrucomicrobiae bacterium]|nr:hypothetical protein [Verrucomicrobiae bacterium]